MKIGVDSNSLTYLIEVVEPNYDPNNDEPALASEKVAMVRLFLYGGEPFYVVPTVIQEYNKIKNSLRKEEHERFCQFLLLDGPWDLDSGIVNAKVNTYLKLHPKPLDCQVVAECEVGGLDVLLT
jgi:hypothetical protein